MNRPTLYMETTIPSYLTAEFSRDVISVARQEITRRWWMRDHTHYVVSISDIVLEEARAGDRQLARKRIEFLAQFRVLDAVPAVEQLTQLYIENGVVPDAHPRDAAHLAFATAHEVQYLCTWNLKHLANVFAMQRLRNLNEKLRLFTPQVCTPEQLLGG